MQNKGFSTTGMLAIRLFRKQQTARQFRKINSREHAGIASGFGSKSSIFAPSLGVHDESCVDRERLPPPQLTRTNAIHTPFSHSDEIRLLRLQPLSTDGEIHCSLERVRLSNNPVYEAVSYAWGETVLSKRIMIENNIAVRITENLHAALQQLARMGSPQLLWIDALCINQSDHIEKSHQVQMMGRIYTQATQVLIWLGIDDDTSTSSMRFIRRVAALVDRHFPSRWEDLLFVNDLTRPKDPQRFKDDLEHILAAPEWTHLSKLFERPWFSRRWVVQEACLAQRALVLCGGSRTSWINFLSAATLLHLYQHARNRPSGPEAHISTRPLLLPQWIRTSAWRPIQAKRKHAMTHPFLRFAGFACQDSRDYVFALLSLINMHSEVAYEPDYTKDTPTVYKEFAAHCLLHSKTLGVLHLAGRCPSPNNDDNEPKLPSWVPNWNSNTLLKPFLLGGRNVRFIAGSSKQPVLSIDSANETLRVKGILVSPITQLIPLEDVGATLKEHRAYLHSMRDTLLDGSPKSYSLTTEPFAQALARTLIADEAFPITQLNIKGLVQNNLASQDLEALYGLFFEFHEQLSAATSHLEALGSLMHSGSLSSMPGALDYFFTSSVILRGRSVFRTQRGHIGLAPRCARVGDVVVVFQGGETPFVVRPHSDGRFRLVGECYVHGIMYGSLWEEKVETPLQEFTLA